MKTIKDIEIGYTFYNIKGKGIITNKTKRTLTASFDNGTTIKNTYKHFDSYFYTSDF